MNVYSGSYVYFIEVLVYYIEEVVFMWIVWIVLFLSVFILFVSVCVGVFMFGLSGVFILWVGFVGWLFIMSW